MALKKVQTTETKTQSKNVGGLWIRTSKNGKEYLFIRINGVDYVAFENTNKANDKAPDYSIQASNPMGSNNSDNNVEAKGYTPKESNVYTEQSNNYEQNNGNNSGNSNGNYDIPIDDDYLNF